MRRLNLKKRGFTLAEVVIVCTIFAMMIVGIILGINRAFAFMNNTRVLVRATNFSREGVEMMYNLRDTNRRKYSGEKDKHWLDTGIGTEAKLGIYVIKEGVTGSNNESYIYLEFLTGNQSCYGIDGFFSGNTCDKDKAKLTFSGVYSYYSGGSSSIETGSLDDLMKGSGVEFYRVVRVFGLFCKNTSPNPDQRVDNSHCQNPSDPKELRFCVKTFYKMGDGEHESELCSIMTNFMK